MSQVVSSSCIPKPLLLLEVIDHFSIYQYKFMILFLSYVHQQACEIPEIFASLVRYLINIKKAYRALSVPGQSVPLPTSTLRISPAQILRNTNPKEVILRRKIWLYTLSL